MGLRRLGAARVLVCAAALVASGLSREPHGEGIRVHYVRELNETQVSLTLDPHAPGGAPSPPGMVLRFAARFEGRRPSVPLQEIVLEAHVGRLWAPASRLSVTLEGRRRIDLAERRLPGGLGDDSTLLFLPVAVPVETLAQIARAGDVAGTALGFEFHLTAAQREALREFSARVASENPAVAGSPVAEVPGRWIERTTGMTFVELPAGHFTMGSPSGEAGREEQERRHEAVISRPFWMSAFEVTQQQWTRVMGANPSRFSDDGHRPVEQVNWFEVQEFLEGLARMSPGSRFRLPTETEWEYACRAGTTTAYHYGERLSPAQASVAAGPGTAVGGPGTTNVGIFQPNAWGLYDMHGNVWEWTSDEHCPYPDGPSIDAQRSCGSPLKVIRGGSWYFPPDSARCALRYTHRPQDSGFSLGVRVVRERAG